MFYMLYMFYLQFQKKEYLNIWLKSPCYLSALLHTLCWQFGKGLDHGPGHLTRMRGLSIKIKEICVLSVLKIDIIGGQR